MTPTPKNPAFQWLSWEPELAALCKDIISKMTCQYIAYALDLSKQLTSSWPSDLTSAIQHHTEAFASWWDSLKVPLNSRLFHGERALRQNDQRTETDLELNLMNRHRRSEQRSTNQPRCLHAHTISPSQRRSTKKPSINHSKRHLRNQLAEYNLSSVQDVAKLPGNNHIGSNFEVHIGEEICAILSNNFD